MGARSLLIIDEMIVPNCGASARSTMKDMTMMTSLASTERTERQWDVLLGEAGFDIRRKSTCNAATGESIIVVVP